jgi:hypothetical protein
MARALHADLPSLQRIVVVDDSGPDAFDTPLTKPEWKKSPTPPPS